MLAVLFLISEIFRFLNFQIFVLCLFAIIRRNHDAAIVPFMFHVGRTIAMHDLKVVAVRLIC